MSDPQQKPPDPLEPAFALLRNNKRAEAIRWLGDYVERAPDNPRALMQLGELFGTDPKSFEGSICWNGR